MNNWSPRKISGATFAGVGALALLMQPAVTQALASSRFWAGLSQAGLSAIGLGGVLIGLYRLATSEKK